MASTTALLSVGTEVVVEDANFPGIWIIRKVNPKNYLLNPKSGVGRGLNAPHVIVRAATDADRETPQAPNGVIGVPYRAPLALGTLVTAKGREGYFVVIADKGQRVNCAVLGGDNDRYWRFPPALLTAVKPVVHGDLIEIQSV